MTATHAWLPVALLSIAASFGCSLGQPALHAGSVDRVPDPNGMIEIKSLYANAKPLTIEVRQPLGGGVRAVQMRAIHDGSRIGLFAVWRDLTPTENRLNWIWEPKARQYYLREIPTDNFAVKFRISGSDEACMMTGAEGVFDVWQWRSGWSDILGYADDRKLTISRKALPSERATIWPVKGTGDPVYLLFEEDAGKPPYEPRSRPLSFERNIVPGIKPISPQGSLADLLCKSTYDHGTYQIEITRALNTGHEDDSPIERNTTTPFSIAITDGEAGQNHYTSGLIRLLLD